MSKKFEQLLDYIVNEEMDKANELFHEIVVEKSRSIYENLIAEEEDEQADESVGDEEEMDESADDEEEMDESADEEMDESADEEMDEGEMDLEDSYSMEADDEPEASGAEETGDFEDEIEADDDMDSEMGPEEASEDEAMMDIKSAIEELEAAFAELEAAQGGEMDSDEFGDEEGDEEEFGDEDLQMGMYEGKKRMTREYVEKVGNDWDKSGSMKSQGQYAGAGTGDKEGGPQEGRSPISSGSGKPTSHANAKNLVQGASETAPDGTKPHGKAGGFLSGAKEDNAGNGNVPGGKMGVKNLKKVSGGHGAEKKGSGPGPVGSGSGDKAGQTSVSNDKQFLKPYKG